MSDSFFGLDQQLDLSITTVEPEAIWAMGQPQEMAVDLAEKKHKSMIDGTMWGPLDG